MELSDALSVQKEKPDNKSGFFTHEFKFTENAITLRDSPFPESHQYWGQGISPVRVVCFEAHLAGLPGWKHAARSVTDFFLARVMRQLSNHVMRMFGLYFLTLLLLTGIVGCVSPQERKAVRLLEPENFYLFTEKYGVGSDPDQVFTWRDGILRISGQHYGYLATKQADFSNYKLVVEYKWGDETWDPRKTLARDSGVLVHGGGKDYIWPRSIEAQIIEGGTGDILVINGAYLTVDGVRKGPKIARFDRPGRDPWRDELGYRGEHEFEKPHGEWNRMEILCDGDRVKITVNGKKTLEGTNAFPTSGKIILQSEGAEIFFRRLDLYPLR